MRTTIRLGMLLALVGWMSCAAQQTQAAVAAWAEEMDALPGSQWGLHDDFQNLGFKNSIVQIDVSGGPGTGAWKHPETNYAGGSMGMVLVQGDNNPIDAIPSMGGPAPAQYTAEIRYKIITTATAEGNDALWFNVGGGNGSPDSGADIRMFEGDYGGGVKFINICGEDLFGCNPGHNEVSPGTFAGTSRGIDAAWSTLRLVQDEVANTQKVYVNGVLLVTQDTAAYNRAAGFTRGLALGFYNHPNDDNPYPEVHYDYIRIANGIVPINEPINAIPEPASGLLTLAMAAIGLAANRRRRA